MAYRVEVTPRAIADADAAAKYLRQHAPVQAPAWFSGLIEAILSLEDLPRRCPLAPEAEGLAVEVRQLLYGRRAGQYRILFRIFDELDPPRVRIVAIRHCARAGLTPEEFAEIV
jgi:plasmid stabilization system protein ParE